MNQAQLKGTVYILIVALVGVLADDLVVWQASTFQPEIPVVNISFHQPRVLGAESETSVDASSEVLPTIDPAIQIQLCKTEAETASQDYLAKNTLSMMTQRYCVSVGPNFPCETLTALQVKYGDPASPSFIADTQTRNQVIQDAIKSNRDARATEVQKKIDAQYVVADKLYLTTYSACLAR